MRILALGLGIKDLQTAGWKSIREWLEANSEHLKGRVLDFGGGHSPYKDLCEDYHYYEPNYGGRIEGRYDTVLCTQVIQYADDPAKMIDYLKTLADKLVITYNASWYEVQPDDVWRISSSGMSYLVGNRILKNEPLLTISFDNFDLNLVYGLIADISDSFDQRGRKSSSYPV